LREQVASFCRLNGKGGAVMKKKRVVLLAVVCVFLLTPFFRNYIDAKKDRLMFEHISVCSNFGIFGIHDRQSYVEGGETMLCGIGVPEELDGTVFGASVEIPQDYSMEECFDLVFNSMNMGEVHEDFAKNPREIIMTFYLCEELREEVPAFCYEGLYLLPSYDGKFYQVENADWLTYVFDELRFVQPYAPRNPLVLLLRQP